VLCKNQYHRGRQPEGYPYVFVRPARYDYIQQELRAEGKWKFVVYAKRLAHFGVPAMTRRISTQF
jgi:hypothetical protein